MAKPNPRKSNGSAARKLSSRLRHEGRGCWICRAFGRPDAIDYSLPAGHPMSFEVDHLVPVSRGGDCYDYRNADATHRRCNEWRGNKTVGEVLTLARGQRNDVRSAQGTCTREW